MLEINDRLRIPDEEFSWTFVRAGGPGGIFLTCSCTGLVSEADFLDITSARKKRM